MKPQSYACTPVLFGSTIVQPWASINTQTNLRPYCRIAIGTYNYKSLKLSTACSNQRAKIAKKNLPPDSSMWGDGLKTPTWKSCRGS